MTAGGQGLRNRKRGGSLDKKAKDETEALIRSTEATEEDARTSDNHHDPFVLTPLRRRPAWLRLDVAPFAFLYTLLIALEQTSIPDAEDNRMVRIGVSALWALTLLCHVSLALAGQWSVSTKARVGYRRSNVSNEKDMLNWTHCLVQNSSTSSQQAGQKSATGIVPVQWNAVERVAVVNFQDRVFRCAARQPDWDVALWKQKTPKKEDEVAAAKVPLRFRPLRYPTDWSLSTYATSWKGHASLQSVVTASQVYGPNTTLVELPSFWALLSEQVVAPFFLFQVFCVGLWSLDEYWYYAIFTLLALLMFESTLAYHRLTSLQRLRTTGGGVQRQRVWVHRGGSWISIAARELIPGDYMSLVVSANRPSHQQQQAPTMQVPADVVLLSGTAVADEALLTGESVPQLKQGLDAMASADNSSGSSSARLDMQQHKESILFGGTVLLMTSSAETTTDSSSVPSPPDGGVAGIVLRTGFETAQGSLLRTMAHSTKSADGIHTWDTFVFILLLVACAVLAAGWVLQAGWNDPRRNRFRLVLHVIIIVTSVVPPELPMELSLAVTNSVAALMKRCQVFCTELFRIPWAGEVDVCCFDKTGTLTSDEMRLRGVRLFDDNAPNNVSLSKNGDDSLVDPSSTGEDGTMSLPWPVLRVMAGCHSLALTRPTRGNVQSPPVVIGDPLEQAILEHTGYRLSGNNAVSIVREDDEGMVRSLLILHRFGFASRLKRMTVLVTEEGGQGQILALTKGAPETIKDLCTKDSIPSDYDDISYHHMSRGRRVLALAYREMGNSRDLVKFKTCGRDAVECELIFVGFLVLDCPLKPDSKSVISELRRSGHGVVMITGDAILTAAEVSRQVGITRRPSESKERVTYQIQEATAEQGLSKSGDILRNFECVALGAETDNSNTLSLSASKLPKLLQMAEEGTASFCISGDVLTKIALAAVGTGKTPQQRTRLSTADESHILLHPAAQAVLTELVPLLSVFARHSPHHKEAVVAAFNHGGHRTLMCGDGTNDVGALKRAHVGISIISAPDVESKQREASATLSELKAEKKAKKKKKRKASSHRKAASLEETMQKLREAQDELDHVELGDASVAAPFTSRAVSIKCCKDVIQQGRCTLVTMLQIYKILGINCLVNALVLSKLFLHGVKQGDRQLTVLGMAVAGLFYFVTRAEPLPTLSKVRPPSSVLCLQALVSITLQFALHTGAILFATNAALSFVDPYDPSMIPDGPFNPNVLNTCTFLLTCLTTINTFAVNYRGRPFMADLHENRLLYRSLLGSYFVLFVCALEVFPPLNDLMQLSPLPSAASDVVDNSSFVNTVVRTTGFPVFLCGLMAVDTAVAFSIERLVLRFL